MKYQGYEEKDLEKAFNLVTSNLKHWKEPINIALPADQVKDEELFRTAIIYYTGSYSDFRYLKNGKIRVKAAGCWNACGEF